MGTTSTEFCYHSGCKDLAKHVFFLTLDGFLHSCDEHAELWNNNAKMIPLPDIVFVMKKIYGTGA